MCDMHSSIGWALQRVGSGIGLYLYMERVALEYTTISSLGLPRPLCEVP